METEKIDVPKFDGFEAFMGCPENERNAWILNEDGKDIRPFVGYQRGYQICYRKIKPKRIVFEFTGEIRPALTGEYFKRHDDSSEIAKADFDYSSSYEIYRIVEEQS